MTSLVCLANQGKGFRKPHVPAKPFISPLATATSPLSPQTLLCPHSSCPKLKPLPEFWGHPALGGNARFVHPEGGLLEPVC